MAPAHKGTLKPSREVLRRCERFQNHGQLLARSCSSGNGRSIGTHHYADLVLVSQNL